MHIIGFLAGESGSQQSVFALDAGWDEIEWRPQGNYTAILCAIFAGCVLWFAQVDEELMWEFVWFDRVDSEAEASFKLKGDLFSTNEVWDESLALKGNKFLL